MTDDPTETKSFNYANRRISDLLSKLKAKGVCGCCTGRVLMYHAVALCEATMGSAEAASMCDAMSDELRKNNVLAPDYEARH